MGEYMGTVLSSNPSNPTTRHPTNTLGMKSVFLLCILAVSLSSIKAETLEEKCEACNCNTASTTVRTTIKSTIRPPAPTTTLDPNYCKDFDCGECSGTATFTMSVVFVLVSVIMSLYA